VIPRPHRPETVPRLLRVTRRRALAATAFALVLVALLSPLARYGEHRSFAAHMAQHLLLGDLAPLALVLGLRRGFVHPLLALPLWLANLCFWHVPAVYEAALRHGGVHMLQHAALFAAGVLVWIPVFSADESRFGVGARLAYVLAMMLSGLVLASIFLWWPRVLYSTYAHAGGFAGMSPLTDQRTGGGLMLLEGMAVMVLVAAWLLMRVLRDGRITPAAEGASRSP
jgi:putative membrane protein